ncbi:MAG TPA: ankyrin repeat domain-containing protein [Saprospiraceae bacterium]|nr:ankyrin repeat domain-containing protein [Saprospiraceae bacterium]
MPLSKSLMVTLMAVLCTSLLFAQKSKKDSVAIADIPLEEMTPEQRTQYLFDAVDAKDKHQIERLSWTLAHYEHDKNGETPLTLAIQQQDVDLVKTLSDKAVINLKNKAGETPLTLAIKKRNKPIIEIVAKRAKAALKNELDEAPLWLAIDQGDLYLVQMLIDNGARLNSLSKGSTPISHAVETGQMRVLALLLKNGADPSVKDDDGTLPLAKAVRAKDLAMAKMLLKKSKQAQEDVNWKNAIGEPLLQTAIQTKNQTIVKLLLDYGAQANALNYFDNSSLHIAADLGELDLLKTLMENGANPELENMMGETALDLARQKQHQSAIELLSDWDQMENAVSNLAGFRQ